MFNCSQITGEQHNQVMSIYNRAYTWHFVHIQFPCLQKPCMDRKQKVNKTQVTVHYQSYTYHRVGVSNEVSQGIQKALVLHHLSINVMKLGHTNSSRFPHIWVLILQALPQRLTQIFCDLVDSDAAHSADSQSSDQWVGVLTVLEGRTQRQIWFQSHWHWRTHWLPLSYEICFGFMMLSHVRKAVTSMVSTTTGLLVENNWKPSSKIMTVWKHTF